ncbi:IclR family transcriptional regulator C-terminal domain-containing protein [Streptomyces sp. NPDC102384]|uniref:IclR family transcriptional regulator domain-containing protein n=1 Tax=Streptomyces sp. NPDC102384 TaxID=3366166 RepID=UPI00381B0940
MGHALLSSRTDLRHRLAADQPTAWKEAADSIEQAGTDGYALDLADFHPDISCVAVPLWEDDRARAAIAVAGPATRLPEARLHQIAAHIQKVIKGARPQTPDHSDMQPWPIRGDSAGGIYRCPTLCCPVRRESVTIEKA